jgi:hypothetical protein
MCYTGKCRYEIYGGDNAGDCSCFGSKRIPDDAACSMFDKLLEERKQCPKCGHDWVEIIIPIVKYDLESPDMKTQAHCISCDWRGLEEELV